MTKTILGIAVLGSISIPVVTADSTTYVDCDRTQQWKKGGNYSQGDKVKHIPWDQSRARQYRCNDGYCSGEPGESAKWDLLGKCE